MKRSIILLVFACFALSGYSQTKSKANEVRVDTKRSEEVYTIYIQLVGDESLNSPDMKLRLLIGQDNKFYVKDKRDMELYDQITADILSFNALPDALNYLGEKGFKIESYTNFLYGDMIRHNMILSRTAIKQ